MPSTFSLFKSSDNRRSSIVSTSSSRSAVSKSTAGQPASAPASTSPQKVPLDLAPSRSDSRGKGATPSQSQRTLPALSTKPLTTLEAPDRSASLPSIDLTSPSSDQPRHLWEPDYQDTNHISPHRSSPAPFGSTAHTDLHLSSSDEEQLFRLPTMPRPTSQHGKGKSEPGIGGSSKKGGKAELPDRHDVMRRAMAEATNSDAFGSMSNDSHSEAHPSTTAPSSHVVTSNSSSSIVDHGEGATADKIGEGRLTFDHFAGTGGDGEVVLADGAAPLPSSAGLTGPSSTAMTTSPSQEGTKVMPTRPKMGSRNNSYQSDSGAAGQAAYTSSPAQSIFNGSAPSTAPLSGTAGKFASSQASAKVATHGRYATTGHVAEQSRSAKPSLTVPPDYSPGPKQHMHESASTSSLLPSPLHRLRKLSDAGSPSGKSKPSGGIAGALAASGMAGMGVGNAALLQQSQTNLSPSKEKTASMARTPSAGADHRSGYQGGVYRDPKTGEMVERGPETGDDEEHSQRFRYMRDRSATASSHSLAGSDMSAASGLNAAANFSVAAAAQVGLNAGFLGPEDAVRKTNGDAPLLTPSGIGATGGLSPSGMGERVALDEEEAWPGDMGAQITGFAVASSKRNADFHALFSSVPEDDYLIEGEAAGRHPRLPCADLLCSQTTAALWSRKYSSRVACTSLRTTSASTPTFLVGSPM